MKICESGGKFSHLLYEKLKVWLKFFPEKLKEHARLLGSSEARDCLHIHMHN